MSAQLNIKNAKTHELARRLAERRNISSAKAVQAALEEALARDEADLERRIAEVRAITAEMRKHWTDPRSSKEIMDSLYDEWGAPI